MNTESYRLQQPPVLIVTPWYGGTHGGVAVATESLAHALIDRGGTCVVLRIAPDGFVPQKSHGLKGEEIGTSKLTTHQVFEIRHKATSGWTDTAIAKAFTVSRSTIAHIRSRQSWKHI